MVSQMLLDDFRHIVSRDMAIEDILGLHYHGRTSLTKTVATSELYFNR
jgi:hypothetical protein